MHIDRDFYNQVIANGIIDINGPFLQLSTPITILTIIKPHLPHYLTCDATIDEKYQYHEDTVYFYTWFHNNELLEAYPGRRNDFYIYNNGTLRLPPNERASGVYRCKINVNDTALLSRSITVEYPVLKRTNASVNITGYIGLSVTFNCPVLSIPTPNITWFYGNTSVGKIFKNNRYLLLVNGSMVLRKLTVTDSGKYKCQAHNQFASKSHRQFLLSLTVQQLGSQNNTQLMPYLQNTTQYIQEKSNFVLLCYGFMDEALIEWWYQPKLIAPLEKRSNNSNEIHIIDANVNGHEGYYTCSIANEKQRFHVIVMVPPTISQKLPSYGMHITASMTLHCNTVGNPKPEITWYHNGALLNSSYSRHIKGNELFIHSFDPSEEGIYQCFAKNIAGEVYNASEIRFRSRGEEMIYNNPLQNIRCFAHSFNTINVTFDNKAVEWLFIVHIVQDNPHRWISPFAPMKLNHTSYVVISSHLPVYRPFELITRVLFPTSAIKRGNKPQQQTIMSSLRSPPVTCCTQGLLLHLVHLANDSFIAWSQPDLDNKKYFILQFSVNNTYPPPQILLTRSLRGTTQHVELTPKDILQKLTHIEPFNQTIGREILQRAENRYTYNEDQSNFSSNQEDIFSLVVPVHVTGILMEKFNRIKIRVLLITNENENLRQDFRYVQWKVIENDTTEQMNVPFRLSTVESRMLVFKFLDSFNASCVNVCHLQVQFPIIRKEEPKCELRHVVNSQLEIRGLKPMEQYRLNFFNCEMQMFYGQLDVQTLPDPPGTICNQRVTRHNGLKLRWDPPIYQNGKIHHYNIHWTLGNVTHEDIVMDCNMCFYKFPNISESAKINVTVRVVGETGVGAPIYIDLRNINHEALDKEHSSSNREIYSGIAIGSLLSVCCICCFVLIIIFYRKSLKTRTQGPSHVTLPSNVHFRNLNNPGILNDSAGGLSGSTLQQDYHEMQTLIPKLGRHIQVVPESHNQYQTTQLPNGDGKFNKCKEQNESNQDFSCSSVKQIGVNSNPMNNLSQRPLCTLVPERKKRYMTDMADTEQKDQAFYIPFKHSPLNMTAPSQQKYNSSTNFTNSGDNSTLSTLPIVMTAVPGGNNIYISRRISSLSSSSTDSNSSGNKKQFHTNFSKHSKLNDDIFLLAEEESASVLTPTSDTDISNLTLTYGFEEPFLKNLPVKFITSYAPINAEMKTNKNVSTIENNTIPQSRVKNENSHSKTTTCIPPCEVSHTRKLPKRMSKIPYDEHIVPATKSTLLSITPDRWRNTIMTSIDSTSITSLVAATGTTTTEAATPAVSLDDFKMASSSKQNRRQNVVPNR